MDEDAQDRADLLLGGQVRVRQPAKGHRAGTDAVLLAACVAEVAGRVVDVGAGVGTVGLAIALRHPAADVLLVERDPEAARLAAANIDLNGVRGRVTLCIADIFVARARRAAGLADGAADLVVTNPPFYVAGQVRSSSDSAQAAAHVFAAGDLTRWIAACSALLRPGGAFAMIHRPAALAEILIACEGRIGALRLLPVHPRANAAASRILVRGRRGSRAAPSLLPGLILHEADGSFTALSQALHRGAAMLDG